MPVNIKAYPGISHVSATDYRPEYIVRNDLMVRRRITIIPIPNDVSTTTG